MTPDENAAALLNPFYAVPLQAHLFFDHSAKTAKEDWVLLNAKLMEDMGTRAWLDEFLDVISLPRPKYDGHDVIDPTIAMRASDRLRGHHKPLVTRGQWLQVNEKLIKELGAAQWLWLLLEVLETGGPE
ncbi:MAG TPA: hypothetical protein VLH84_03450 [Patescibacteria group bacterium]|nr:hypothetical protein [Patescibacteria group bacterium]